MIEYLGEVLKMIVPPPDAEHAKQYAWRLAIATLLAITFTGLIGVTAVAFGWFPAWAEGFARTSEVRTQVHGIQSQIASVQASLEADRAERIEGELLQLRKQHCDAKGDAKDLYWSRIAALLVTYQKLTGRVYTLPSCTDL